MADKPALVGDRIHRAREALGLTQDDLAERVLEELGEERDFEKRRSMQVAISRYEQGTRRAGPDRLRAIARALGMASEDELLVLAAEEQVRAGGAVAQLMAELTPDQFRDLKARLANNG